MKPLAASLIVTGLLASWMFLIAAPADAGEQEIHGSEVHRTGGLCLIVQNFRHGYIDKTGKVVIPPQFERAGDFSDGVARVKIAGTARSWAGRSRITTTRTMTTTKMRRRYPSTRSRLP